MPGVSLIPSSLNFLTKPEKGPCLPHLPALPLFISLQKHYLKNQRLLFWQVPFSPLDGTCVQVISLWTKTFILSCVYTPVHKSFERNYKSTKCTKG